MNDLIKDGDTNISADIEWRRCAFAHSASLMLREWTNFELTAETMSKIIGEKFDDEVSEILYDPNSGNMDTCIREQVLGEITHHYLGRNWPTYGDNVDFEEFERELREAIESTL